MLDHMILNLKKWFSIADNDEYVNVNGKRYMALPAKVTIRKGASLTFIGSNTSTMQIFPTDKDYTRPVIGYLLKGRDFTNGSPLAGYIVGESYDWGDGEMIYTQNIVSPKDVKNVIWGGKALLSHLYQWFRHTFTRNEVIACL